VLVPLNQPLKEKLELLAAPAANGRRENWWWHHLCALVAPKSISALKYDLCGLRK
jgi:hypothetical protein